MLLIRNPISSTKKFLRKTIHTFKSFFAGDAYQKLPKTSPLDAAMEGEKTKRPTSSSDISKKKTALVERNVKDDDDDDEVVHLKKAKKREERTCYGGVVEAMMRREERRCFVAQMLRELEMVDNGNLDHMLDIEEVLHYYSRLNCPTYLDIVDRFFLEIYAEFFGPPPSLKLIRG